MKENALDRGVDMRLITTRIADPIYYRSNNNGEEYTLWDIYPHADFITYPSLYEGFGNAFLESVYFKKPLLINRYSIFIKDIEPKGFDLIVMDGYITKKIIAAAKAVLESSARLKEMVEHNYDVAFKYYSYSTVRSWLETLMIKFFGVS